MVEVSFDTAFAQVKFWAKGDGLKGRVRGQQPCPPRELGFRADWCILDALHLECPAGAVVEIGLDYCAKDGWTAWQEGGEFFDCALFEHADGHQAAISLRDYEWLEDKFDMTLVEGARHPAPFRASFKTNSPAEREIEISLALTNSPANDFETIAPWLIVDKALKF